MAHAMGRVLVLPPATEVYKLTNYSGDNNRFSFHDFFHLNSIASEHKGMTVITMEEFLEREALTGHFRDKHTGEVSFPPENSTQFDGYWDSQTLWMWLRNVTKTPLWDPSKCVVAFGSKPGWRETRRLKRTYGKVKADRNTSRFTNNPTAVDGHAMDRLDELLGDRNCVHVYGEPFQNEKVIHFMGEEDSGGRILVHFYNFLFFEGKLCKLASIG